MIRWILLILLPFFAYANPQHVIEAPHGLGQFHEEPTSFRPSMKGANKFLATFEGMHHVDQCLTRDDFIVLTTGSLARHTPSPQLGQKGPAFYPEVHFELLKPSISTVELVLKVYLWLPAKVLAEKKNKKIMSFQYQQQEVLNDKNCKEKAQIMIDEVIDRWMADYYIYNDKKS